MTQDKPDAVMPKILNCPFCGEHADLQTRSGNYAGYYVSCHTEDCAGNPSDDGFSFTTAQYAIDAWNKRPTPPQADQSALEIPDGNFYDLKIEDAPEKVYFDSFGNAHYQGTWTTDKCTKWKLGYVREDIYNAALAVAPVDVEKIKIAIANYIGSEGCSCCEGSDHDDHKEKLGELLKVPKYSDNSGYDFKKLLEAKS